MEVLNDFDTSVRRALGEIDNAWESYDGLIITGTHNPQNTEELIALIRVAREDGIPYYGECFGWQLACIEWARNKMGIKDATSEEFGEGTFVVKKLPKLNVGLHNGESYWNNYEVVKEVEEDFTKNMPPNFFVAQYHASYQSMIGKPHPLIKKFINYAKDHSKTKYTEDDYANL